MLVNIGLAVLVLIVLLLLAIATRPATFRIERSTAIAAPPAVVFALLNDFHQWVKWSPWEKLDAAMTKTFGGPSSGEGATYHWVGNKKVGEGRMTMVESRPYNRLRLKLEFIKPWTATNETIFTLTPSNGRTQLTWTMDGRHNFMTKAFSLVMSMDKMVGKDFEKGLAELKRIAEDDAS